MSSGHRGSLGDENGEGKDGYVNVYNGEDMHEACHPLLAWRWPDRFPRGENVISSAGLDESRWGDCHA